MTSESEWIAVDMGMIDYKKAHALQRQVLEYRHTQKFDQDLVLLLEHPPVFTLGRRGGRHNLIVDEAFLQSKGIDIIQAERGGDVTYHAPGQLVVYFLIDLKFQGIDIPVLVQSLETVMIRTAGDFGIEAHRDSRNPGIWVKGKKLGSIGIAIRHGISFHGIALNVNTDMTPFQWVHSCGLKDVSMTSLAAENKTPLHIKAIKRTIGHHIERVFDIRLKFLSPAELSNQLLS